MRTRISTSFSATEIAALKEILELINGDRRHIDVPRAMKARLKRRVASLHQQLSRDPQPRPRKKKEPAEEEATAAPKKKLAPSRW